MKQTHPAPANCECAACGLRTGAFVAGLEDADFRQLDAARSTHPYQRGHFLFYEGNPCTGVFCIQSGVVKLVKGAPQGRSCTLALAGPGDVVGMDTLLADTAHGYGAVMLAAGVVCQVERFPMLRLLDARPALQRAALHHLAAALQRSHGEIAQLAGGDVRERTAHILLMLASRFGERVNGRMQVALDLGREDFAEMIGVAAETASRAFSDLKRRGIVSTAGRAIVIEDMDRLLRVAKPPASGSG